MEKLGELTLPEYTSVTGDPKGGDSFSYWLESKTEEIGSIWGGSAFKFGVYERGNTTPKPNTRGRMFGSKYAWYEKYGATPEAAFEAVKQEIISIANGARSGQTDAIESANLGPAVKWKIAFLYQPQANPYLLPIFSLEILRLLTGNREADYPELYAELLKHRGEKSLFEYASELWARGEAIKSSQEAALAYLQSRFTPIKEPVQYMAGFVTKGGRQIGLVRRGREVAVYVEPGNWEQLVPGTKVKEEYAATSPRISSLAANAPKLSVGFPAQLLLIPSQAHLVSLCDAYEEIDEDGLYAKPSTPAESMSQSQPKSKTSMNIILYGPPGTGKTYATAHRAVQLCDGFLPEGEEDAIRIRFEELRQEGRVSFITFHQSYGYEEFVEGLRPVAKDGQVVYEVQPGAFKRACNAARLRSQINPGLSGQPLKQRTLFKMSLGASWNQEGSTVFDYCIKNNCVLLGWGNDIDFSECASKDDISKKIREESPNIEKPSSQASFVDRFKHDIKVGDLILVSLGNKLFRAVAEVTGDYEFVEDAPFHQMRSVRWLAIFEGGHPASELYEREVVMSSLYVLNPEAIRYEQLGALLEAQTQLAPEQPHVLIIDEINRANISKVFGELITLIEPDKRAGQANAVTVKLPYSGEDFSVPSNLHLLGTMNTADRSIALLDTALRRRFEFEEVMPMPELLNSQVIEGIHLGQLLQAMNQRIEVLYDRDHTIGHAYLMGVQTLQDLDRAFRFKVLPLLQEYFYENWSQVRRVLADFGDGEFVCRRVRPAIPADGDQDLQDEPVVLYSVNPQPFPISAYKRIYGANA